MDKLHSVDALRAFMMDKDYESDFPASNTLRIDTSDPPPDVVARQIAVHCGLLGN
jgi:hypothetical protein